MRYKVSAKFRKEKADDFLLKLTDGTVEAQEPDGREIVASMKRAKIGQDGAVHWNETCYCSTPLAHERQTVYDHFFTDFRTETIDKGSELQGQSFMDFLSGKA